MPTLHENIENAYSPNRTFEPKDLYHYDPRSFIFIVDKFLETGELPQGMADSDGMLTIDTSEPVLCYIIKVLLEPNVQARVLTSKIMAKAFRDMMVEFIIDVCAKVKYQYSRYSGEEKRAEETKAWSLMKRQEGGNALLQQIGDQHEEDGFDREYYEHLFSQHGYADDNTWCKMCQDWQQSIQNSLKKKTEEETQNRGDSMKKAFSARLDRIKRQLDNLGVSDFDAIQAWQMMDGQWTETEFEKQMNVVRIQNRYPEIAEVCRKMGRVADDQSLEMMKVSTGRQYKMEHAGGSDIEGVTMGNDFTALLPHEVAQFADEKLENLFFERFVTKKLQVFRYKSEMNKPSRKLNFRHASRRGPMIVCVDSSASMTGVPQKISASLLGRLEATAEKLNRDCFLIDFSVDIKPVDLRLRFSEYRLDSLGLRSRDINFSQGLFPFMNGGTDATKMLDKVFELLDSSPTYQYADVLWITDFLIPLPEKRKLQHLQNLRQNGTCFYGFQIGDEPNKWAPYFDKIYTVRYRMPHRF